MNSKASSTLSTAGIFVFATIFLCLNAIGGATTPQNPNLKYFGLWTYDSSTDWVVFKDWTNLYFSDCNISLIEERYASGQTVLCNVENFFFTGYPLQLVSDYRTVWKNLVAQLDPYLTFGQLSGFFLGDELVWNGLKYDSLVKVTDMIRHTFPDAIIYYNEAYPVFVNNITWLSHPANYTRVPVNLNYISIDIYPDEYPNVAAARQVFNKYLYPLMQPSQSAIYVPPAYSPYNETFTDTVMVQWAQDSIAWAMNDTRLVGLLTWHWNDLPESPSIRPFAQGLMSMHKVQSIWIPFGEMLRGLH